MLVIYKKAGVNMKLIVTENYEELSKKAAEIIAGQMKEKSNSVLGLATGSTPVGTYKELVAMYNNGEIDFTDITTVNLDEYKGLDPKNDQSYRYFMQTNLFDHVNVKPEKTFVPDGTIADSGKACSDYDKVIEATGGIDLQLLGLGHNGHIGFNEPAEYYTKGTHCVKLTESTINANSIYFASIDEVPKEAYTMGIGTIMSAAKVLIIVSGKSKAPIVKEILTGPITPKVPATALLLHRDCIMIVDKDAYSEME